MIRADVGEICAVPHEIAAASRRASRDVFMTGSPIYRSAPSLFGKSKGTNPLFCFQISVDFSDKLVGVGSVNGACHFNCFLRGTRAA